jgi:hypothetical protein
LLNKEQKEAVEGAKAVEAVQRAVRQYLLTRPIGRIRNVTNATRMGIRRLTVSKRIKRAMINLSPAQRASTNSEKR